ncbi:MULTISPECIES: glycosyltransferase [Meridianimaribacter]|uniref:Uncharacterized protein (TIGR00661 family) n=1 Tax=Meridianimaribacter flavus TaxID=571115 RepID=A0ABY2G7S0_9FLAO|nr:MULTISPECIES: glycosyltransferase [Meridianimaribacter]TBV28038.1 glycosyltransferase [Meridianimaribacter sp. CL38]TDY13852.1 uncharacterized protein (TIGR00661 family) [Meridianimaribacter flavus]
MILKKRILVAPLNWGLGHATRCIPIINALLKNNYTPVIASDGIALELLKKEFPDLIAVELPSYGITYAKKGKWFKLKIISNSPKVVKAIKREKQATKQIIETYDIDGIISDNRLGVCSKTVPSVFITHQLQVLSGSTTWISTKIHQKFIKKFNECWVPDNVNEPNLSGKLGHVNFLEIPLKYIGPISRFKKLEVEKEYDIMALLSGPEPQRTLLEEKLLTLLENYNGNVLFVKGLVEDQQTTVHKGSMTIYNYMTSEQLELALNQSDFVISRSGYTTIMDLAKLNKKGFFIPTPGQFEQEYLAKKLDEQKLVPTATQDAFTMEMLEKIDDYKGLAELDYELNYKKLFSLFKGK